MKVMQEGQQEPVHHQIDVALAERVTANRQRTVLLVRTVLFCGIQNIALRGHLDSDKQTKANASVNHCNLRTLLEFRFDTCKNDLAHYMAIASRNTIYTSATIQNDLINIIGNLIHEQIIDHVRDSTFYSVIANELTDSAKKEQLSLVLHSLNPETGVITEDLVEFAECDMGIADYVLHLLQKFNLDPTLLCGQGYNGARNMVGKTRGTAAIITVSKLHFMCTVLPIS